MSRQPAKWAGRRSRTARCYRWPPQHFDVFVTVDRNLGFQQHIDAFAIAVVVMHAKTNRLADLRKLAPDLLAAIESAQSGRVKIIGSA